MVDSQTKTFISKRITILIIYVAINLLDISLNLEFDLQFVMSTLSYEHMLFLWHRVLIA